LVALFVYPQIYTDAGQAGAMMETLFPHFAGNVLKHYGPLADRIKTFHPKAGLGRQSV
jgi:hypothetical protein